MKQYKLTVIINAPDDKDFSFVEPFTFFNPQAFEGCTLDNVVLTQAKETK